MAVRGEVSRTATAWNDHSGKVPYLTVRRCVALILAEVPSCMESGAPGIGIIIDEWQKGCEVKYLSFWGQEIIWWARWGKLMQFTAALVVVLDLVGSKWFEKSSVELGDSARTLWRRIGNWNASPERSNFVRKYIIVAVSLVFVSFCSLYMARNFKESNPDSNYADLLVVAAFAPGMIGGSIVAFPAVLGVMAAFGQLVLPGVLSFMSRIVALGKHGRNAQWIAVVLVIVGFSFDMLGS